MFNVIKDHKVIKQKYVAAKTIVSVSREFLRAPHMGRSERHVQNIK